jgi:hypothetical protein
MARLQLGYIERGTCVEVTADIDSDDADTLFGLDVQVNHFINFLKAQGFSDSTINEALGYCA